jgi:hypothetical protein
MAAVVGFDPFGSRNASLKNDPARGRVRSAGA